MYISYGKVLQIIPCVRFAAVKICANQTISSFMIYESMTSTKFNKLKTNNATHMHMHIYIHINGCIGKIIRAQRMHNITIT